jgi:gluconate 2-dehydrogenase gamma chain
MNRTTRREALIVIAGAAPLGAQQQHQHGEEAPASTTPYKAQTLTPVEMEAAAKLSDLIIPRTETPGASDAGVPEFIDRRLTATPTLAAAFRHGLGLLGPNFVHLPTERQVEILTEYSNAPETEGGRFFRLLKDMTIDGYYSSRAGLTQELGWHGNTFLTEFKGCTHPEHQS